MDREDAVEAGDPEDGHDPAVGDHELERSVLLTQALEAAYHCPQAGGVQETHLAQVGDDVPDAVGEQPDDAVAHLRGGVHVDLAGDLQDGAVGADGDGFQVKGLHGVSVPEYRHCES